MPPPITGARYAGEVDELRINPGRNLDGAIFGGAGRPGLWSLILHRGQFDEISLHRARFVGAALHNTSMKGADLKNAVMHDCALEGADLTGATCTGVRMSNSSFEGTNFRGVDFSGSVWRQCRVHGADFSGADLRRLNFLDVELDAGTCFKGALVEGLMVTTDQLVCCPSLLECVLRLYLETSRKAELLVEYHNSPPIDPTFEPQVAVLES
jgi:uncharacterized protein YjbI with pentapeptide repeats